MSAVILDGNRILLVRRGQEPSKDLWSLPGGRVEPGETVREALVREVLEETSLSVEPVEIAGVRDVIARQGDDLLFHYVIISFRARVISGEPAAATDVAELRWVPFDEIAGYPTTEGLVDWLISVGVLR